MPLDCTPDDYLMLRAYTARYFRVSEAAIAGQVRTRRVVTARRAAAWLLVTCGCSYRDAGDLLGCVFTTVRHHYQRVRAAVATGNPPSWYVRYHAGAWQILSQTIAAASLASPTLPDPLPAPLPATAGAERALPDRVLHLLADQPEAQRQAVAAYVACRMLGQRHVPGTCRCLAGWAAVRTQPDVSRTLHLFFLAAGHPGLAWLVERDRSGAA